MQQTLHGSMQNKAVISLLKLQWCSRLATLSPAFTVLYYYLVAKQCQEQRGKEQQLIRWTTTLLNAPKWEFHMISVPSTRISKHTEYSQCNTPVCVKTKIKFFSRRFLHFVPRFLRSLALEACYVFGSEVKTIPTVVTTTLLGSTIRTFSGQDCKVLLFLSSVAPWDDLSL